MTKTACPYTKEELDLFYENAKVYNINFNNALLSVKLEIDCLLRDMFNEHGKYFKISLKWAEEGLVEAAKWQIEQIEPEVFKTFPLKLRREIGDNYFNQVNTYDRLKERLNAVKKIIAYVEKQ